VKRIPEPELMDAQEQARAYAEADFSEPNELFVEQFRRLCPDRSAGWRILDLGCGPADIPLRLAERYGNARILALDGAQAMLDFGRRALARKPHLVARIELRCERLPSQALQGETFDAVVSNSLLHHLHRPQVLWETVCSCARPGGAVLIMDLMRPALPQEVDRLVADYAADSPEVLQRDFRNSLLAAFSLHEVRQQLRGAGLEPLDVATVSDRHLCVSGFLPVRNRTQPQPV